MAEAGLTWGCEPRRAGVARLKNGCEPPPCGTGWASWGSGSPSPAGMWAGGGRDDRGGVRSLPGPRTAPKAFLPPCGAGTSLCAHQQPPPWRRKSGRARVPPGPGVSSPSPLCAPAERPPVSLLVAEPSVSREPRTLAPLPSTHDCLSYVASKTHPGTEDAVLDRGQTRAPGVPTSQSPSRGLWAGDAGQWGIESLLWRTGREAVGAETTRSVVSGPAEARRPPSPARPGARDPPRLAAPRRSVGLYFYSFNFFFPN